MMGCSTLQIPQGGKRMAIRKNKQLLRKDQKRKGAGGIIRQMRE